jgi:hypothetical protein
MKKRFGGCWKPKTLVIPRQVEGSRESYLYVLQRAPSTSLGMRAAASDQGYNYYGVRSGAFCSLSGSAWFMLGCAITGGR